MRLAPLLPPVFKDRRQFLLKKHFSRLLDATPEDD
jgi:hypothetical protein